MTKQLLGFIVGATLVGSWWVGLSFHWNNDVQFFIPVIATGVFILLTVIFFQDNWDK